MEVLDRLNAKKEELKKILSNLYSGGSQRGGNLKHRIKRIDDLIDAYETINSSVNLLKAEEILNQQVGFEEQKKKILELLETTEFRESRNIQKSPLIFCLVGPIGVGKTTFAKIMSQALNKKLFSIALGGLSDASMLVGTSESSSGTEIGQLTKSLVETKTRDPLLLLDEIDKSGSLFKTSIQDCLLSVFDKAQNQEVLDHYLDVKLDFSQVTFIVTANDPKKIPQQLLSRMLVIELPGYNLEQKKEIAKKFIEK
jgi:ATP-dependent Lon protease